MPRIETRFGATTALGTTYTNIATIGSGTAANILLNVTNRTTGAANLRAYVAASGWTTGEPTGATLVSAIAYDASISPGAVVQYSGIVMNSGEKLVVYSSAASSLDIIAAGVAIS